MHFLISASIDFIVLQCPTDAFFVLWLTWCQSIQTGSSSPHTTQGDFSWFCSLATSARRELLALFSHDLHQVLPLKKLSLFTLQFVQVFILYYSMKKPHDQVVLDKYPLIERLFVVFVFSLGTTPAIYYTPFSKFIDTRA